MNKRVFIVHRWYGSPTADWYQSVKQALEEASFKVDVLAMPYADTPDILRWTSTLRKHVGQLDKNTFFIGHSIGCQTILRYLQHEHTLAGGAVFVAPWLTLHPAAMTTEDEEDIARSWIESPIDFEKIHVPLIAFFSEDDPYVPLDNIPEFERLLKAKIHREKSKGHYTDEDGVTSLPHVVAAIRGLATK